MDISKLILAALASSGVVHPGGHVMQGAENGTPTRIDYRNFVESREGKSKNVADEAEWHGAGFEAQENFKRALDSPEGDLATGLYKLLYPYTQKKFAPTGIEGGDIGGMARASGNKHVNTLLQASALWDIIKSTPKGRNTLADYDISFTTIDGSPGLVFKMRY